jgi:hypothetical protein
MKKLATIILAVICTANVMAQSVSYCNASLKLDGINDYGAISNMFFQNNNQRNFTIEFYLKPDTSQSQYPGVWGKTGLWSEINVELYVPGKVRFSYATSVGGNQYFGTDTVSWSSNIWDYYAIVGDSNNNKLRIYKNGVLYANTSHGTPDWSLPNSDSKIGAVFQGWTAPNIQYLKGRIDDFRVSDIARYSSNFAPPRNLVTDSNTRVLYNFNSIAAGVVPDLSGNNNNLTLQNGASIDADDVPYTGSVNFISNQPSNSNLNISNNAQFNVVSSIPTATYQWQTNGINLGWQNVPSNSNYSGGNSDKITINNVQLSNHNQQFRVIATSGTCKDTSNIAYVKITDTCITKINDTVKITKYDTIKVTKYDTIKVTDTLVINATLSGVSAPNNTNRLLIYPNPAKDHITIDYGIFGRMSGYTLKIVNTLGQIVFSAPINQQTSYINLSTWTGKGMYYVQIFDTQNNLIENRKIVLQ